MTLLDNPNPDPRGKWGWWGDPNISDEDIVDYEMRNKRLNLPGLFGGIGPRIDENYGYIPGRNSTMPTIFGGIGPRIHDKGLVVIPGADSEMVLRYPQTPLPGQTGFEFGDGFAMGTDPFGGGIMNDLAGRYGLWGGLGGLIGGAIGAFTKGRK